jgi:sporulation protein YlmC with PRC-barrel domain
MMLRTAASVAALTLALGVAGAAAQTTAPQQSTTPAVHPATTEAPKMPVTGQIVVQDVNAILVKDLIGQTVYAPDKAKIGSISDLILSKDAKTVEGFVIGVGGFLGLGEKSVALKIDRLQLSQSAENGLRLMMDVKKEELANAPSFKSKRDQDAEKQAAERARERPQVPAQPGVVPAQPDVPTQRPGMN